MKISAIDLVIFTVYCVLVLFVGFFVSNDQNIMSYFVPKLFIISDSRSLRF